MEKFLAFLFLFTGVPAVPGPERSPMYMQIDLGNMTLKGYNRSQQCETVLCTYTYDANNHPNNTLSIGESYQGHPDIIDFQYEDKCQREFVAYLKNNPNALPRLLYLRYPNMTPTDPNWISTGFLVFLDKTATWIPATVQGNIIEIKIKELTVLGV